MGTAAATADSAERIGAGAFARDSVGLSLDCCTSELEGSGRKTLRAPPVARLGSPWSAKEVVDDTEPFAMGASGRIGPARGLKGFADDDCEEDATG